MKTLICPHCDGTVSERARVCRGCGAEIVRGATRKEKNAGGCITTIVGMPVALAIIGTLRLFYPKGPQDPAGLYLIVTLFIAMFVFYKLGELLVCLLRRSKLRFYRSYEHS